MSGSKRRRRRPIALSHGVKDAPTSKAIRQLEGVARDLLDSVDTLSSGVDTGVPTAVPTTRRVDTTAPLTGGGDLSADRTLAVSQFDSTAPGVVPPSGGGTSDYLRADGTWDAPPGDVTLPIAESDVTNLTTDLAAKAPTTRTIATTSPLAGGGDLSADRTLSVSLFSSGASGVVPASGGGTANFLRADGTWAAPTGVDCVVTPYAGSRFNGSNAWSVTVRVIVSGGSATGINIVLDFSRASDGLVPDLSAAPTFTDTSGAGWGDTFHTDTKQLVVSAASLAAGTYTFSVSGTFTTETGAGWAQWRPVIAASACNEKANCGTGDFLCVVTDAAVSVAFVGDFLASYSTSSSMSGTLNVSNRSTAPGTSGFTGGITDIEVILKMPNCTGIALTDVGAVGWVFTYGSPTADSVTCTLTSLAYGESVDIGIVCTSPGSAQTIDPEANNIACFDEDTYSYITKPDVFNGNITINAAPSWTTDATSGIAVPANSTEWTSFISANSLTNWSVPDQLWLMQDTSGALVDVMGVSNLSVSVAGATYADPVTGWSRKGVKFTDGTSAYFSDGVTDHSVSAAALFLAQPDATPAGNRWLAACGAEFGMNTTPRAICSGNNTITGTNNPTGAVRPWVIVKNFTSTTLNGYTDQEHLAPGWVDFNESTRIGGVGFTSASQASHFVYGAKWHTTHAERSTADVKALVQAFGYTVTAY